MIWILPVVICILIYLLRDRIYFFGLVWDTQTLLDSLDADASHDIIHALEVLKHGEKSLKSMGIVDKDIILDVKLACFLHDVDDKKVSGESLGGYPNAEKLLLKWFPSHLQRTIRMIQLVSCSTNGNRVDPSHPSWYYIPRYADRLEAMGYIGITRCYDYTLHIGRKLYTEYTPRVTSEEELNLITTKERFEGYLSGVPSATMIDHFYDKLLHLKVKTGIEYIDKEMEKRHQIMVDFVLEFGRNEYIK